MLPFKTASVLVFNTKILALHHNVLQVPPRVCAGTCIKHLQYMHSDIKGGQNSGLSCANMGQIVHNVNIVSTFVNFVPNSQNTHFQKITKISEILAEYICTPISASFIFSLITQEKEQSNCDKYMHCRTARVRTRPNRLRVSHVMSSS